MNSNIFKQKYDEMWPDEIVAPSGYVETKGGKPLNKMMYGRRKMKVVRSMTEAELFTAFASFGIKRNMSRDEMLRIVKYNSWRI